MELSLFLAKVIGLGLMLIVASLLSNRKNIDLLFDAYKSASAVYVTGIFETFLGLSVVLSHNIWTADFRVVITLVGWLLLVRGVERSFFASRVPPVLEKFKKLQSLYLPLLVALFVLGAYLAYAGFTG